LENLCSYEIVNFEVVWVAFPSIIGFSDLIGMILDQMVSKNVVWYIIILCKIIPTPPPLNHYYESDLGNCTKSNFSVYVKNF